VSREHPNRYRHLPTPDRYDRTEDRDRCRPPNCTSSADTTGCGGSMRTSGSAARAPSTREISVIAGVAQSVAQLSCKQQVRGSSPLASSLTRANAASRRRVRPSPHSFDVHRRSIRPCRKCHGCCVGPVRRRSTFAHVVFRFDLDPPRESMPRLIEPSWAANLSSSGSMSISPASHSSRSVQ
jgi:hypothetical protein